MFIDKIGGRKGKSAVCTVIEVKRRYENISSAHRDRKDSGGARTSPDTPYRSRYRWLVERERDDAVGRTAAD